MRIARTRNSDSTFDLNLAPFLDIIMSVIPMLLLSVVFIQIKMIETPIPQVVQSKIEQQNDKKIPIDIALQATKNNGFVFTITNNGKKTTKSVPLKDGKLDFQGLNAAAIGLKQSYADVFKMDFNPGKDIAYNDIVMTMDQLRKLPDGQKVAFKDDKTGKQVETDLMFPDVTFGNVLGD